MEIWFGLLMLLHGAGQVGKAGRCYSQLCTRWSNPLGNRPGGPKFPSVTMSGRVGRIHRGIVTTSDSRSEGGLV